MQKRHGGCVLLRGVQKWSQDPCSKALDVVEAAMVQEEAKPCPFASATPTPVPVTSQMRTELIKNVGNSLAHFHRLVASRLGGGASDSQTGSPCA